MDKLSLPTFSVYTRREVPGAEGYRTYSSVSDIVDALADVFPIFMYFVAALVTLTTMTRFVDEERINSGTLKALGYEERDIIKKFSLYGLFSGLTGAATGIAAGLYLLPRIANNAYAHGFTVPKIETPFHLKWAVIAVILAMLSTVLPAVLVAKKELQEKPSALLQPKPPANGSKILLERITPIWNRMSISDPVCADFHDYRSPRRSHQPQTARCGYAGCTEIRGIIPGTTSKDIPTLNRKANHSPKNGSLFSVSSVLSMQFANFSNFIGKSLEKLRRICYNRSITVCVCRFGTDTPTE